MIPWFQYTVWQLGPIPIQVWGFFVALGMVLSIIILWKRAPRVMLDRELLIDQSVWMIFFGVVVARLFHIIFYEPAFFLANPLEIFKIWHGGMSSFGGLLGAVAAFFYFAKRKNITKSELWKRAELLSYSALFGWIVGRLGCVMIHDHMGRPCDCFLAIDSPDGPRLEMAIFEIIGLLPLAILFYLKRNKRVSERWFTATLFIYYGVLRFILDFFRATDIAAADARYLGLTPAQYFGILLVGTGIFFLYKKKKAHS
jgi:phosphatidylglycerol:prolipoprotein diacylglycerol transferase